MCWHAHYILNSTNNQQACLNEVNFEVEVTAEGAVEVEAMVVVTEVVVVVGMQQRKVNNKRDRRKKTSLISVNTTIRRLPSNSMEAEKVG